MIKKSQIPQMEELKSRVEELENQHKRALADYQNLERRHESRLSEIVKYANQDFLTQLLPVIDNIKLALKHLNDPGLEMVVKQLEEVLLNNGVLPIIAQDQPFDPNTMDCIEVVMGPKDQVVEVVVPGFLYHDKILRPAKVKVGSGESKSSL
jgi:molecular chaperone GrpE